MNQFASEELQNDRQVVLTAVKKDEIIVLHATSQEGTSLNYAYKELQNNKKLLELSVNNTHMAYHVGDFYKECVKKLKILNEQEWLNSNLPINNTPIKARKF